MSRDLVVRREKVSSALMWLVKHNPAYKDIKIDYNCLASLPLEGIPTDLLKVSCAADKAPSSDVDLDRGPLDIDEIPCNKDTKISSMKLLNPVELKQQKQLITDEILQNNKLGWPDRQQKPLNEFKIQLLATMAFPTLFPDSKGDPTNAATRCNLTLG